MNNKRVIFALMITLLFSCSLFADWVTLTDGRDVRGIDFKKIKKGYLFTIETGKTVFIRTVNFASHKRSEPGEKVYFRGKSVSLRKKIYTLRKEHKKNQGRLLTAIRYWAAGGRNAKKASSMILELPEQEREILFGKTMATSPSASARKLASKQIAEFKTSHARRCLATSLITDNSQAVRKTCAKALKTVADDHLGERFIPFLLSRNKSYRLRASKALQSFPTYRAVPALITSVTKIWTGGQRSFFYQGSQRAYIKDYELVSGGTTFQLTEVADPIVEFAETGVVLDAKIAKTEQHYHVKTLQRITGLNYGTNMGKWLEWWRKSGKDLALKREKVKRKSDSSTKKGSLKRRDDIQKQHKYLYWQQGGLKVIRTGKWKALLRGKKMRLHNLEEDIAEKKNVAEANTEVVARIRKMMEAAVKPL